MTKPAALLALMATTVAPPVQSETDIVCCLCRIQLFNQDDLPNDHALQKQFRRDAHLPAQARGSQRSVEGAASQEGAVRLPWPGHGIERRSHIPGRILEGRLWTHDSSFLEVTC